MKIKITAIFLLIASCSFCQTIDSLIEDLSRISVYIKGNYIKTDKIDGKEYQIWLKDTLTKKTFPLMGSSSGTGFFVGYRDYLYLVTAEHVARKVQASAEIIIASDSSMPMKFKLSDLTKDSLINWVYCDKADVAVLPIHPESNITSNRYFQALPLELFYTTLVAPLRNKHTLMVGFPLRYGVEKRFSPISMSAYPASGILDLKRADNDSTASFFLLDAPSVPGLSGGPVLTLPAKVRAPQAYFQFADSLSCVGLVHGVISDQTGGKFAAIVPSEFIVQTIKKAKRFEGTTRIFHSNGKLWSERLYKDGYFMEVLSNYDKNGNPMDKGTLKNGTGTVKNYDKDGKLIQVYILENGVFKEIR